MANPIVHILFQLPGMGIAQYLVDWMHTKHLGVDQNLFGSVIMWLILVIYEATNDHEEALAMGEIFKLIKKKYEV